jgi:predicted outer membrane repeat protein
VNERIIVFLFLVGIICTLAADTIPGGYVSGTWYAANSPYYITGNILLQDTLIIEPGVEVNFLGDYQLWNYGIIVAIGTEADSIRFFAEDTAIGWHGILYSTFVHNPFTYCIFENALSAILVQQSHGTPVISHCNFRNNRCGVDADACHSFPQISNSIFHNNTGNDYGGAIRLWHVDDSLSGQITDCVFENNAVTSEGGAIYCRNLSQGLIISDCIFTSNTADIWSSSHGGGALCAESSDVDLSYCVFNQNYALYDGGAIMAQRSTVTLDHCTFSANSCGAGVGVALFLASSDATISNSIFAHNPGSAIVALNSNIADLRYSDFYDNNLDVYDPPPGFGILDTVNYNGDSCDIYFNIFMDPLFEDTVNGNYHLTAGSPCIDAGDPLFARDPDNTISDQGAFYFDQTGVEEIPIVKHTRENTFLGATIFKGPLLLPEGGICIVFDIAGRIVEPDKIKPGIYFIEVDGIVTQKVVKIQ